MADEVRVTMACYWAQLSAHGKRAFAERACLSYDYLQAVASGRRRASVDATVFIVMASAERVRPHSLRPDRYNYGAWIHKGYGPSFTIEDFDLEIRISKARKAWVNASCESREQQHAAAHTLATLIRRRSDFVTGYLELQRSFNAAELMGEEAA